MSHNLTVIIHNEIPKIIDFLTIIVWYVPFIYGIIRVSGRTPTAWGMGHAVTTLPGYRV